MTDDVTGDNRELWRQRRSAGNSKEGKTSTLFHRVSNLSSTIYWQQHVLTDLKLRIWSIDNRWEDGRFSVSESCVIIPNPDFLLSSSETEADSEMSTWKKNLPEWAEALQPGLKFGYLKPRPENDISKCISWLNGSDVWVMIRVYLQRISVALIGHILHVFSSISLRRTSNETIHLSQLEVNWLKWLKTLNSINRTRISPIEDYSRFTVWI